MAIAVGGGLREPERAWAGGGDPENSSETVGGELGGLAIEYLLLEPLGTLKFCVGWAEEAMGAAGSGNEAE